MSLGHQLKREYAVIIFFAIGMSLCLELRERLLIDDRLNTLFGVYYPHLLLFAVVARQPVFSSTKRSGSSQERGNVRVARLVASVLASSVVHASSPLFLNKHSTYTTFLP